MHILLLSTKLNYKIYLNLHEVESAYSFLKIRLHRLEFSFYSFFKLCFKRYYKPFKEFNIVSFLIFNPKNWQHHLCRYQCQKLGTYPSTVIFISFRFHILTFSLILPLISISTRSTLIQINIPYGWSLDYYNTIHSSSREFKFIKS